MSKFVHSVKAMAPKHVDVCIGFDATHLGSDCKSCVLPSLTLWASVFSWLCIISEVERAQDALSDFAIAYLVS